jgi:transcription elongation factor Elf1
MKPNNSKSIELKESIELIASPAKVRYVKFTCAHCGAVDTMKLFENENAPEVINCWNCHAGFKKSVEEMILGRFGMFPANPKVAA